MQSEKLAFAQRLRQAMEAAGHVAKPAVLEREFNLRYWGKPMTLHGVRRWLQGETLPSQAKLVVLAQWLAVDPQYLRFGHTQVAVRTQEPSAAWRGEVGWSEREMVEALMALPVPQRRVLREVIQAFVKAHGKQAGST